MPQGYSENPTYFPQILKADLADVDIPDGSTLIQYIDDLILCSKIELDSQKDTIHLLHQLASKGPSCLKVNSNFAYLL